MMRIMKFKSGTWGVEIGSIVQGGKRRFRFQNASGAGECEKCSEPATDKVVVTEPVDGTVEVPWLTACADHAAEELLRLIGPALEPVLEA